jgi:hypothetical protein
MLGSSAWFSTFVFDKNLDFYLRFMSQHLTVFSKKARFLPPGGILSILPTLLAAPSECHHVSSR